MDRPADVTEVVLIEVATGRVAFHEFLLTTEMPGR
jgi:hypothetical protein